MPLHYTMTSPILHLPKYHNNDMEYHISTLLYAHLKADAV